MNCNKGLSLAVLSLICLSRITMAQTAGTSSANDLVIAQGGATQATIVIVPEAGKETVTGEGRKARTTVERAVDKQAATDLAKYIEMMTGAAPAVVNTGAAPA